MLKESLCKTPFTPWLSIKWGKLLEEFRFSYEILAQTLLSCDPLYQVKDHTSNL